jgi:hypothetical protein
MAEGDTQTQQTQTQQTQQTQTQSAPWFDGFDAEEKGYITNRGLDKKTPVEAAREAIKAHRAAESKLGFPAEQLARIPKDPADQTGWAQLFERLGRPKDANGYDFTAATAAGADEGFLNFFKEQALALNLTKDQAERLAKEYVGFADKAESNETAEQTAALALEQTALDQSWGFNKQAFMLIAKNAAEKLGIKPEAVAALEKQVGYRAVMEMFLKIGTAIGEDKFVQSVHGTGQVMTSEGAAERLAQLKSDPAWVKRYQRGGMNSAEFKEMQNLIRLANTKGGN